MTLLGSFILGGFVVFIVLEKRVDKNCTLDISNDVNTSENFDKNAKIFADISGAVENPGLYELEGGSRVGDLITIGGGIKNEASARWISRNVNLSKKIEDSSKIYIPFEWEVYTPESYEISSTVKTNTNSNSNSDSNSDSNSSSLDSDVIIDGGVDTVDYSDVSDSDGNEDMSNNQSGKINVNTASSSELDTLPGIGPANAEKIITNRSYKDLSEFESKSGLYKSTIEGIKDLIIF